MTIIIVSIEFHLLMPFDATLMPLNATSFINRNSMIPIPYLRHTPTLVQYKL